MSGIIGEQYIAETEITAYFARNEVTFDFDWFQTVFYALDDEYIKVSREEYKKASDKREAQQKVKAAMSKGKRR